MAEGDAAAAGPKVFDYRRKILNYVAGSAGQESLVGKSLLRLPKVHGIRTIARELLF